VHESPKKSFKDALSMGLILQSGYDLMILTHGWTSTDADPKKPPSSFPSSGVGVDPGAGATGAGNIGII
jgi:hypothetical protein